MFVLLLVSVITISSITTETTTIDLENGCCAATLSFYASTCNQILSGTECLSAANCNWIISPTHEQEDCLSYGPIISCAANEDCPKDMPICYDFHTNTNACTSSSIFNVPVAALSDDDRVFRITRFDVGIIVLLLIAFVITMGTITLSLCKPDCWGPVPSTKIESYLNNSDIELVDPTVDSRKEDKSEFSEMDLYPYI